MILKTNRFAVTNRDVVSDRGRCRNNIVGNRRIIDFQLFMDRQLGGITTKHTAYRSSFQSQGNLIGCTSLQINLRIFFIRLITG